MKTDIEIVTGFIGSGKTSFINALIEITLSEKEKLMVILCEKGEKKIKDSIQRDNRVTVKEYDPLKDLTAEYLKYLLELHRPHRVIIEYNGTRQLNSLTSEIDKKEIRALGKITTVFHIADAQTFDIFINNMGNIFEPYVYNSNMIVVNNKDKITSDELENIRDRIEAINAQAYILSLESCEDMTAKLRKENILDIGAFKNFKIFMKNVFR